MIFRWIQWLNPQVDVMHSAVHIVGRVMEQI